MAYLSRFNQNLIGITLDIWDHKPVQQLWKGRFDARFVKGRSQDFATRVFDFCFIDGDHTYDAVSADFANIGRNSKICAFHDVNDAIVESWPGNEGGVPRFREQLKGSADDWKFSEFTYHSRDNRVMGIGVATHRDRGHRTASTHSLNSATLPSSQISACALMTPAKGSLRVGRRADPHPPGGIRGTENGTPPVMDTPTTICPRISLTGYPGPWLWTSSND
jgi:hypothetical protein